MGFLGYFQAYLLQSIFIAIIAGIVYSWPTLVEYLGKVRKTTLWALLIVVLLALVIRLFIVPHTVHHTNFHAYEYIQDSVRFKDFQLYGYGYYSFFNLLFKIFPTYGEVVFSANAILGGLTVGFFFLFVFLLWESENIGLLAAIFLAFLPAHAKLSGTETFHILIMFLALVSLSYFLLFMKSNDYATLVTAVLCLSYVTQSRILWSFFMFHVVLLFLFKDKNLWEHLKSWKFWAIGAIMPLSIIPYYIQTYEWFMRESFPPYINRAIFIPPYFCKHDYFWRESVTPTFIMYTALLGIIVGFFIHRRLWLYGILALTLEASIHLRYQSPIHADFYRFQIFYMALYLIFSALSIDSLRRLIKRFIPKLPGLEIVTAVTMLGVMLYVFIDYKPYIDEKYNPQLEYDFILENLSKLPEKGILIILDSRLKETMALTFFPDYELKARDMKYIIVPLSKFQETPEKYLSSRFPVIYYRGLTCQGAIGTENRIFREYPYKTTTPWGQLVDSSTDEEWTYPLCRQLENRFTLETIIETEFDNRLGEYYLIIPCKTVRLGFYRILSD